MSDSPEPQTTEQADEVFEDVLEDAGTEVTEPLVETEESPEDGTEPRQRDDQGRFVKEEGTEPSEDAPEPESPVEPEVEASEVDVFRYQAEGREIEIPGSAVGEQGMFIPTDQIPDVTRMFRESQAFRGSYQRTLNQKDRERQQVTARAEAAEEAHQTLQNKIEELVTNEGAFDQFILDQRNNWQVIKAQANEAAKDKLLAQERADREVWESEKRDQELRPVMYRNLDQGVRSIGTELGLPERVVKATFARMAENLDKYFPIAEQDDPRNGVQKGGRYNLDVRAVERELRYLKDVIGTVKTEPKKVQSTKKPPPTVPARKGPAPTGKKKPDFSKADDPTAAVDEWFDSM